MDEYGRTLTHAVLTGVVREFEPPASMLGSKIFTTGPREQIMGQSVQIDIVRYPRTLPKYRHVDAKSGKNSLLVEKTIMPTMPCIKESVDIGASVLNYLREPGTEHQAYGKAKIADEAKKLDILIENRREKSRFDVLTTGIVSQARVKADDMAFSIDFGTPTTPDTHLPIMGTTAGYGVLWSTVATSTPASDIEKMKAIYEQDSGKPAKVAILNSTVMNYLINSTVLKTLMGESFKSDILRVGRIQEALGLEFWVYNAGYTSGSTFYPFVPSTKFILWSGEPFPEYVGLAPDVDAITPGKFSKAFKSDDPSGITLLETVLALPSGERASELFCATVA
jgi:hypothetical protein